MTNQEIKTVGQTIAAETQIGGNTAERVGGVIEGIGEALDNKDATVGYYLATMSGSTIYINASSYRLGTGGNLRAKMPAAATTTCTLTVGNANAVPLWYNGAAVSADNSWEAGEIVTIFYDGTRFMASNSQGGGGQFGSGEKIKDILLSQALGDGTGTITSQKGVSDAIFNEIDISSIDSLKTLNDALAPSSSLKPTYYTVTATLSNVKLKVGSMAVISDNMRHVVTEIMATHYTLDDTGTLTNEHSDAEIFFIYRSVKLSGGTLPDPAGTWTKWRYVNSSVWSTAAEKIKYDNTTSGLAAENVQGALDELGQRTVVIDSDNIIDDYSNVLGYFFPDSNNIIKWQSNNKKSKHRAIPVEGGGYVKVVAGNTNAKVVFATSSYTTPTSSSHNSAVPLSATDSTMHSVKANTTNILPIPDDCAYILVDVTYDGNTIYTPQAVYLGTGIEDKVAEINDLKSVDLLNIHFDGKGTTYAESDKFYAAQGHILKFILKNQDVPYDTITSAQSRFMIYSHDANNVRTTLYRVNGTNLPDKEIVVCVPDDSVCLYIGGRCSRGYRYECEVIDITCEYENTPITANDLYYHLGGNPQYNYRINLLLPYQDNMVVKIHPKISSPTHQWIVSGIKINNDKTITTTSLTDYANTYVDYVLKGDYSFILFLFKEVNNEEVDKATLLQEYDIQVGYSKDVEELELEDGEKKWDLIGLAKIANHEAKTDFIVFPNLPMKVRMDIPVWFKVSFTTGNRSNRVDLGTYYSGDIVDFPQGSAGVFVDFKRLDDRGFDGDFYTRQSKFSKMSLTQIGSNDGNIFERNFDNEKNLGGIMTTGSQSIQRFPTIVHVSDAHGDETRLNSAHDYADYIKSDLVVNTGDNPFFQLRSTQNDGVEFVKDIVFAHKTDFANCIGNHDQYTDSLAEVFSLNISPFATEYGYHKSTSSDVTDKCYYFKDLSAQKIRLIALDIYDGIYNKAYRARVSQEQINWFISTLASTPSDYGVIVIMHQAPHTINAISGKENFNDITMDVQTNAIDSNYMQNGKITGNPFGKIIDAFITKGSVSGSYTQIKASSTTSQETISYSADFSNVASGVEFIAYLNGHTHRDFIGYVADCENNQLNCNVCSTSPLSQTTGYGNKSDIYRDANGVAQDAFNVYTIDRYNHRVGVCRIGSNLSLNLIDRKVMWFSYR